MRDTNSQERGEGNAFAVEGAQQLRPEDTLPIPPQVARQMALVRMFQKGDETSEFGKNHRPLDDVLQFPNIPRPH